LSKSKTKTYRVSPEAARGIPNKDGAWDSGLLVVKSCEVCEQEGIKVMLSPDVYEQIRAMCDFMDKTEWLGYLIGTKEKGSPNYKITGITIPEQEVSASTVDVKVPGELTGVVGTVHSHGNMGAFFSGTDSDYIGSNHDVMVVTNTKDEWKAKVRWVLPCKHLLLANAKVKVQYPITVDLDEFVLTNSSKIKEKSYVVAPFKNDRQVGIRGGAYCVVCRKWTDWADLTWYRVKNAFACKACIEVEAMCQGV